MVCIYWCASEHYKINRDRGINYLTTKCDCGLVHDVIWSYEDGKLGMERFYGSIEIQAKDESCDWRSFAIFRDENGDTWELRGYGKNPADAATDAYNKFKDRDYWHTHGIIVPNLKLGDCPISKRKQGVET